MKKIFFIMSILLSIGSLTHATAYSSSEDFYINEDLIKENIDLINISEWDVLLRELENSGAIPGIKDMSVSDLIKDIALGKKRINSHEIIEDVRYLLFKEIRYNYSLLIQLIVIAVLCGIIESLTSSFENTSIADIAYFTCYIAVVIIVFRNLLHILGIGKEAIDNMVKFMHIIFPSLMALILVTGGVTTAAILQPAFMFIIGLVGTFLKSTMIPLIFLSAVLSIITNIDQELSLTKLNSLVKSICTWILGITFTIFIGVMVIQGVMTTTFDGVSIRTTKYAIESFVPIVGGLFSKTVDTIIGCSIIVKNAVGVAGLLVIALICLIPCMKIFALLVVYKLSSALVELISDKRIANCLYDMSGVMSMLLITVLGISIVFFLTISIMIAAGNAIFFMR